MFQVPGSLRARVGDQDIEESPGIWCDVEPHLFTIGGHLVVRDALGIEIGEKGIGHEAILSHAVSTNGVRFCHQACTMGFQARRVFSTWFPSC